MEFYHVIFASKLEDGSAILSKCKMMVEVNIKALIAIETAEKPATSVTEIRRKCMLKALRFTTSAISFLDVVLQIGFSKLKE